MNSLPLLLLGGSDTSRKRSAGEFLNTFSIHPADLFLLSEEETNLSIEQVRNLLGFLSHGPQFSPTKGALLPLENASPEAMQALLKLLEEPPDYVRIVLTAQKQGMVLPTILSRCLIKTLPTEAFKSEGNEGSLDTILSLAEKPKGTRFAYAALVAQTRESAISWLTNTMVTLHKELIATNQTSTALVSNYASLLRRLSRALWTLSTTSTNPRLLLENLFLSLSRT